LSSIEPKCFGSGLKPEPAVRTKCKNSSIGGEIPL